MTRLPIELVPRILTLVAEEHGGLASCRGGENWRTYKRFFYNAALVCRTWNSITKNQDITFHIDGRKAVKSLCDILQQSTGYNIKHLNIPEDLELDLKHRHGDLEDVLAYAYSRSSRGPNREDWVTSAFLIERLPTILAACKSLVSLSLSHYALQESPCAHLFQHVASSTRHLQILGDYLSPNHQTDLLWNGAIDTYLGADSDVHTLSLDCQAVLIGEVQACCCKSLQIQGGAVFDQDHKQLNLAWNDLFPKLEHFSLVLTWQEEQCWLALEGPCSNLVSFEHHGSWRGHTLYRILAPDFISSPRLSSIRLTRTFTMLNEPEVASFRLPGRSMPALRYLFIDGIRCASSLESLVKLCASFEDPQFCPRLASLPQIMPPGRTKVSSDQKEALMKGLAGIKARGIAVDSEGVRHTLWKYATWWR